MTRPRIRLGTLALAALVAIAPAPVRAWTPRTRVEIADEAVRMMPPSLRLALERQRDELLRGTLEPMARENDPAHRPPWNDGTLDAEIESRASSLVRTVDAAASFREVARAFGALAHFVEDAAYPPGAAGREGSPRYAEFGDYLESRRPKFPLVFYGHEDGDLARGDFRAFALREMGKARQEYANLARVYETAGDPPDPAAFDDRSIPFAVASLSYSRTVTLVVRAWLAAWKLAHGDLGRTPYLASPAPGAGPERNP